MTSFSNSVAEHQSVISDLDEHCQADIQSTYDVILATFNAGKKVLICGNGGSASDSQHIAAEFMVRYEKFRQGLPAIALTTDTSILTAHPNDFEFETVFARQVETLGQAGDCLIAITTSGNSANILHAVESAKTKQMHTIGLTGNDGGKLISQVDQAVVVPSKVTARVQEAHILIAHWWCQQADEAFAGSGE
ncbi:MAG: SIS domain-containing protein [Cocleimonas sp.]